MNPIIARELISHFRIGRTFRHLFVLLLLAGGIFCLIYSMYMSRNVPLSITGRSLFYPLIYLSCLMVVPLSGMAANAIVQEREKNTLELLLNTPLKNVSILLGKSIAVLLYGLLILSSLLPMLSICFLMGGLSPSEVIQCYVVICTFYCFVAVMCIAISLFSRSSGMAVQLSSLAIVLFLLTPMVGKYLFLFFFSNLRSFDLRLEMWFNPVLTLIKLHNPSFQPVWGVVRFGDMSIFSPIVYLQQYPGFMFGSVILVLTIGIFFYTTILFRKYRTWLTTAPAYKNRRFWRNKKNVGSDDPTLKEVIKPYFGLHWTAVSQRERLEQNRRFLSRWSTLSIASLLLSAVITWFIYEQGFTAGLDHNHGGTYIVTLLTVFPILFFFVPVHPSYCVLREFQRESWPLLRNTMFSSFDIVFGKVYGSFRHSMIPIVALFFFYYLFMSIALYCSGGLPHRTFLSELSVLAIFLTACVFFYSCVGIYFSGASIRRRVSPHRKTVSVVILHVLLPYLVFGIFMLGLSLIAYVKNFGHVQQWFTSDVFEHYSRFFIAYVFPFSPLYYLIDFHWDDRMYWISGIHVLILLCLGVFLISLSTAQIQRRD